MASNFSVGDLKVLCDKLFEGEKGKLVGHVLVPDPVDDADGTVDLLPKVEKIPLSKGKISV